MEVKEFKTKHYIFKYKGSNHRLGNTNTNIVLPIKNNSEDVIILDFLKFKSYDSEVSLNSGKLNVRFGCLCLSENDIILGYKQLMGEDTSVQRIGLKKKEKKSRKLTTNIIEESENYYISSSGKAYLKKDYEKITYNYDPKIVILKENSYWAGDNGWTVKGRSIGKRNQDREDIISAFTYYNEVIKFLKNEL